MTADTHDNDAKHSPSIESRAIQIGIWIAGILIMLVLALLGIAVSKL